MRFATSTLGFLSLAASLMLASPGVRAEPNVSYDPALEPVATRVAAAPEADGPACAAGAPMAPLAPLRGLPLLMAQQGAALPEGERLNSLNGRGYNIGPVEPSSELRKLELEVLRRARRAPAH